MKIYTEEQVRQAFRDGFLYALTNEEAEDVVINALTPIELPTDEDVLSLVGVGDGMHDYYKGGFIEGAKWVIDNIKK